MNQKKPPVIQLTYEFYRAVKSSTSCVMDGCGTRQNLTFHHVEPANKKHNIASIARVGTVDELLKELKKCVPLCENHHREVHMGRRKGWLKGKFDTGEYTNQTNEADRYLPFKPFFTGLVPSNRR